MPATKATTAITNARPATIRAVTEPEDPLEVTSTRKTASKRKQSQQTFGEGGRTARDHYHPSSTRCVSLHAAWVGRRAQHAIPIPADGTDPTQRPRVLDGHHMPAITERFQRLLPDAVLDV